MQKSQAIARLIGPVLCAIGIGMLTNGATYREMAGQFLATYPFIYFSGILILVAGLLILNVHNVWTPDWRSVITALGWLMCIGGVFRISRRSSWCFSARPFSRTADSSSAPASSCSRSAAFSPSKATRSEAALAHRS